MVTSANLTRYIANCLRASDASPGAVATFPVVLDGVRLRGDDAGGDRGRDHQGEHDERTGPGVRRVVEESDADGEERGDRVAAALHEPAERHRALVRAGAQ